MESMDVLNCIGKIGISLSDEQAKAFVRYYELLVEWNSFMNLTAITEPDEVLIKHFADSLSPFSGLVKDAPLSVTEGIKLIDVGTGAGFPALPLKIAFPQINVTMLDSLGKRVKFLNEVITQLGLTNTEAIHGRAEDLARDAAHRENYDIVVSRAVANMRTLSEYCMPFVKQGGTFLAYKAAEYMEGAEAEESLKAIKILGGEQPVVRDLTLPDGDSKRCLVYIRKNSSTPKKYPRKAGTPSKEPL